MGEETIYIAGPMRGLPDFNFPAFDTAAAKFRMAGWKVINPAEMDRELDGFSGSPQEVKPFSHYMRRDIQALLGVTAVAFLPGWTDSEGARVEFVVGKALGLEFFYADTLERLPTEYATMLYKGVRHSTF